MKTRNSALDLAKGIAIVLMIVGHGYSSSDTVAVYLIKWFYSFHMPLFFIVSGILYRIYPPTRGMIENLKHRFEVIMIPYFFWNTTYQMLVAFLQIVGGHLVELL